MEAEILDFMQHIRPRIAATTYRRKAWMVQAFARYLGKSGKPIATATRADVEAFLLSLDAGQQYRQALCATIRDLFAFLKVPENPAAKIAFKPDHSRKLPKVPSQTAIAEIIDHLSDDSSDPSSVALRREDLRIRDRLMVELAYGSGLRRDELRKVNVEDVDLEGQTVRVNGKGNKTRIVPVTTKAAATARMYLSHRHATRGPLLVSYAGRRLSCMGIYTTMRTSARIRPHLLRHACATHMLANGCGVRVIGELLGHADLASTQIYTSIEKGNLARILNERHPRAKSC